MISLLASSTFSYAKERGRINEDCILPPQLLGDGYLMAIADGVGSYAGADRASRAAIQCIREIPAADWAMGISSERIFSEIKRRVSELSDHDQNASDAATTITFCYVNSQGLRIGHIGDCRAYLRKGMVLKQLTSDHTQHQRLMDEGLYRAHELKLLGGKNTLYAAVSKKLELQYQELWLPYSELDLDALEVDVVLMSDGAHQVWDMRSRFALSTMSDPGRFAASLKRRIGWVGPSDDYSLISSKFLIDINSLSERAV